MNQQEIDLYMAEYHRQRLLWEFGESVENIRQLERELTRETQLHQEPI